jgi:hypothetical protein
MLMSLLLFPARRPVTIAYLIFGFCVLPYAWTWIASRAGAMKRHLGAVRWITCASALLVAPLLDPDIDRSRQPSSQSAVAALAAQQPPTPAESTAHLPDFEIHGLKIGGAPTKEFIANHCPSLQQTLGEAECLEQIKIRGKTVWTTYKFYNQKLVSVEMMFSSDLFPDIVEIYRAKLDVPPSDIREEPVQNRLGATFSNATVVWQTTAGDFTIRRYDGSSTHGSAEIVTPKAMELDRLRNEKRVNELRGKF